MRQRALVLGMLVVVFSACMQLSESSREAVPGMFALSTDQQTLTETPAIPRTIRHIKLADPAAWTKLCSQCHTAPAYSSGGDLLWGHRASCLSGGCVSCHTGALHDQQAAGYKPGCFDCHAAMKVDLGCEKCHREDLIKANSPHKKNVLKHHKVEPAKVPADCLNCHGSQSWCDYCHGLPMPHPEDILKTHGELGKTVSCKQCHGRRACQTCHKQRGVKLTTKKPQVIPGFVGPLPPS